MSVGRTAFLSGDVRMRRSRIRWIEGVQEEMTGRRFQDGDWTDALGALLWLVDATLVGTPKKYKVFKK